MREVGGMKRFSKGDHVAWNTPQGRTTGVVREKLTEPRRVGNDGQRALAAQLGSRLAEALTRAACAASCREP